VYRHRGKVIARTNSHEYTFVWKRLVKRGKIFYQVNRDHPLVRKVVEDLGPRGGELESVLRLVEETVPAPLIALDMSEKPDEQPTPFEGSASSEILAVLSRVHSALRGSGLSDEDIRTRLLSMEPFNQFPELVTSFWEDEEA
jgi:hypothetical protein